MATISPTALASLADVRSALGLDASETMDDDRLISLINSTSLKMERYTKRKFLARSYMEFHDGDGSNNELLVDQFPIISVSGLYDDVDDIYTEDTLVQPTDYVVEKDEGVIRLINIYNLTGNYNYFNRGIQNIRITYSGGYTEIPADVNEACVNWVLHTYRRRKDRAQGYQSKSAPGGNITFDLTAMPSEVKQVCDYYRKHFGMT